MGKFFNFLTATFSILFLNSCAVSGIGVSLDESSVLGLPIIDRPEGDSHWFIVPQLESGEEV